MAALLTAVLLSCFALSPSAQAVVPAPDGGYAGFNTAEGTQALQSLTTGPFNTAVGFQALFHNTSGSYNSAEGLRALFFNTTGSRNTATGVSALFANTTGSFNEADGINALFSNTTGTSNAANGSQALFHNTTGGFNTGTGTVALFNNTTGFVNAAHGCQALFSNTTGTGNTADGFRALFHNTTGSGNIALGRDSGFNLTIGDNNIDIGSVGVAGESGIIRIGTAGTHTTTVLSGNVGLGTDSPQRLLQIGADLDALFTVEPSDGSPNAGFIRFGDHTGWKLHFARSRESSGGALNTGTTGTIMTLLDNGIVGIGTTVPTQALLVVNGSVTNPQNAGRYFDGLSNALQDLAAVGHSAYSIFASNRILAGSSVDAVSDARIKCIEGRSDAVGDLNTLMKIEVTNYKFKDKIAQGNLPQKKVIGQQVEQVYPQAVNHHTDVVPDIYQKATVKDGWVQLASDLKVGERVRLIGTNEEGIHEVLEVTKGGFRTDFKPVGDKVFVYGREVKDCRSVDYEAISMLNVSATQELARKLVAKDAEIARLTAKLASATAKQEALIAQQQKDFQSAIAQQQKEMETVVARLKEQESKIQKVNARLGLSKAAPQMVAND